MSSCLIWLCSLLGLTVVQKMDEQSQTTQRHFGLSQNVPPTPSPTSMPPLRPQNPECLFPDQPCNTMYHLPTCWNCSLLMMPFQIVRLQVAPDDGSRRSSDGTEEEPPMHLRGTPGPAPRSPRSRDGRASSAAQRSHSPRRTRRGGSRSVRCGDPDAVGHSSGFFRCGSLWRRAGPQCSYSRGPSLRPLFERPCAWFHDP